MKFLLLLITILVYNVIAAQKKPSQSAVNNMKQLPPEMQKQMQQALKEIDALEKEDPEAAKMARQLLNQVHSKSAKVVPQNTQIHQITSPIVAVKLPANVAIPNTANARDHLLWYKGKLINDSVLITTKGNFIVYNKRDNRIIVKPNPPEDQFGPLVQELMKTEERKKLFVETFSKKQNCFFYYPL
ncbi:MAG TPA: hypothetical protein VJ499_11230, partial [Flavisolibacter sp.]|nr:hypothetical protein [Flavisolibacter sp.]